MSEPDARIWDYCVAHVKKTNPAMSRKWFAELEPIGVTSGVLYVRVPQPLHLRYLQKECTSVFQEAAQATTGRLLSVRFVGDVEEALIEPKEGGTSSSSHSHDTNGSFDAMNHSDHATASPGTLSRSSAPTHQASDACTPASASASRSHGEPPLAVPGSRDTHAESSSWMAMYDDMVLNPDYTFDHFVHGPSNRLAFAAARAVADNPGRSYNPFFIHGGVGLGKTHLLQAICHEVLNAEPQTRIYFVSCEGFVSHFMEAVQAGRMADFRHRFRHVDVLVVDDIHFLGGHEQTQEEFFHTFNSLYQAGKQVILSSDAAPMEIPDIEERLTSRFKAGLVARMDQPDYETRLYILRKKAALRNVEIPDDVLCLIADRVDSNVRELEGALTQIQGQAMVTDSPITIELAQEAIGDHQRVQSTRVGVHDIINAVSGYFDVKTSELLSRRRSQSIALPRQIGMYLTRQFTSHSLQEIGVFFGGRDHTTVMHALEKIERERAQNPGLDRDIHSLEHQFQPETE